IDHHGELVGPLPCRIANDRIAVLHRRVLPLRPQAQVVEGHHLVRELDTHDPAAGAVDRLATAGAGISSLAIGAGGRQVATGACAAVEPPLALEAVEGTVVPPRVVALAPGRRW